MVEIVAKSKEHFLNICKAFQIDATKAIFIDSSIIVPEPPEYSPPIYDCNVKRDGSDWIAY